MPKNIKSRNKSTVGRSRNRKSKVKNGGTGTGFLSSLTSLTDPKKCRQAKTAEDCWNLSNGPNSRFTDRQCRFTKPGLEPSSCLSSLYLNLSL